MYKITALTVGAAAGAVGIFPNALSLSDIDGQMSREEQPTAAAHYLSGALSVVGLESPVYVADIPPAKEIRLPSSELPLVVPVDYHETTSLQLLNRDSKKYKLTKITKPAKVHAPAVRMNNAHPDIQPPPVDKNKCPGGQCAPTGDIHYGGDTWEPIVVEEFTKKSKLGSWDTNDSNKVVYEGDSGTDWTAYPNSFPDTRQDRPYRPRIIETKKGKLIMHLGLVDGHPAAANISPTYPNGSRYIKSGIWSVRMRTSSHKLDDYYVANLQWTETNDQGHCGEADWPEGQLNKKGFKAFSHYCDEKGATQATFPGVPVDMTQWHTYTTIRNAEKGLLVFMLDGKEVGRVPESKAKYIYKGKTRMQLQFETNTDCDMQTPVKCTSGEVEIDWVSVHELKNN